ncbi:hypothetical protein AM501_12965 [Aneurinibacillus migulanus]|uniref:hypothetical protein n=1 Tax=Aneurinibacillus migulanus TaxID=47500 RepID=UPI0005BD29A0|nr:hypothetical protein [Aneurinibacillus migulanus]KIV53967.1 hypothetical protein TS64_16735 [Aneurinibacillus migulanus]KPD07891.1 hypothetical protein AM501_12965 [Aneurinibacillus migulanus]
MDKVKLTKKQAEIIESIKDGTDDIANFLTHWHTAQDKVMVATKENFTPSLLMKAWEHGYEIDLTPEEKVREFFDSFPNVIPTSFNHGVKAGVVKTLDLLGIKIEGINA